jgi:hypothetical protein
MTPHQFVEKWRKASDLSERSACQQHFLDLCDLLGEPKPAQADRHPAAHIRRAVRQPKHQPRYTPTTCFETFPFPKPTAAQREAVAAAAKELDALRSNWLHPPGWTRTEVLEFPGSADGPWKRYVRDADPARGVGTVRYPRTLPKDAAAAAKLKARTLTNLYNELLAWLTAAHRRLDGAVAAAYGWPADLSDDALLARLLDLNLSRAGAAAPGPDDDPDD